MHKKYRILIIVALVAAFGAGIGSAVARSSGEWYPVTGYAAGQADASNLEYQPDETTLRNYAALKGYEARFEGVMTGAGWTYIKFHREVVNDQVYRPSGDPSTFNVTIETWSRFNGNRLVDQEIGFFTENGEKYVTVISYRGAFRGKAGNFEPVEEGPYKPSLYFYIGRAHPVASAKEGVQVSIDRGEAVLDGKTVVTFTIRRLFPNGMPGYTEMNENINGSMHVLYLDPDTAQPLRIENYFLLNNADPQLHLVVTGIEIKRVAALPGEIQQYFDQYDHLDWASLR